MFRMFDTVHAKCNKQPSNHTIHARIPRYYSCNRCLHTQRSFFIASNFDSSYDKLSIQNTNSDISNCIKRFLLLILTRKLSVQHLTNSHICWIHKSLISEIWLKDNPHLLDYVKIDSYEVKFRNAEHTRGGGVGSYVRSDIRYKLRNIVNINTDTEHLWLEVTLRNKN